MGEVAEGERSGIGGVRRPGRGGEPEEPLDHHLHLLLVGAAGSAHRALDLLGRVGAARQPALAGGEIDFGFIPLGGPVIGMIKTGRLKPLAIGGNRTLGQPTNQKVGQSGFIRITQDATGHITVDAPMAEEGEVSVSR